MQRRSRVSGITMVETALLVSLLGIVLAVGVPAFGRALHTSKISEASRQLAVIYRGVASYYDTPQPTEAGSRISCLPASAGPTPELPSVKPQPVTFGAPDVPGGPTWRALGYEPNESIRYRYSVIVPEAGCSLPPSRPEDPPAVTIQAEGDLDGDETLSRFARSAARGPGGLEPSPLLTVENRVE